MGLKYRKIPSEANVRFLLNCTTRSCMIIVCDWFITQATEGTVAKIVVFSCFETRLPLALGNLARRGQECV